MSIKNSKSIGLGFLRILFIVSTLVCVILRSLQVLLFVEAETGFTTGGEILFIAMYIILAFSGLCYLGVTFLSSETLKSDVTAVKSRALTALSAVAGVYLIFDFFQNCVASLSSLQQVFGSSGLDIFRSLMLTETLPNFFGGVFAVPSAVFMLVAAKSFKQGNGAISKHKLFALAPVCWTGFKLIKRFVRQISFIEVSDLLLELAMLAFLLAFFYSLAQASSGVYSDSAKWRLIALGFASAQLVFTVNLPRLILIFTDGVSGDYQFNTLAVVLAAFACVLSIKLISRSFEGSENNETKVESQPDTAENKEV